MDIRKLQRAIVDGLEDVKAQNIVVFNTEAQTPLFERVIIASGSSNRQTKALASSVRETVKSRGMEVLRMEGEDNGEWIIVDCGAAVAHIMQPSIRDYYHLEEIWGAKPVSLKRAAQAPGLVKAAQPQAPAPRKAAPGTAATRTAPARKVAAKKAPADKAPAKKAPAEKTVAVTAAVKKPTAKKPAVKKPAVKKPAVKKPAAKKAPARKVARPAKG